MSMNTEGMQVNLIDGPDLDFQDCRNNAEVRYSVLQTPRCDGKRPFYQEPFKVATVCRAAFCLLLLVVLVATNVHSKSSSVQDVTSRSAEAHMLKTCANVPELTSELQALRKEKSELEKERSQLKAIIAELEASASTPVQVTTQSTPGRVTASDSCPSDWHYFSGSCYFISDDTDDWSYSQSFCKQRGGHLAIIHTPEEQTFIWDLLPRGHWNAYWIGISDEKVEDDWYWVDGTKLVGGFWEDGEPNNHMNEDCGNMVKTEVLNRTATKSWYDAPCDMSRRWICEKETDVHSKSSSVQDVTNGSAEAHMLKTCANVTELTSELQALRKEKSELEKERSQLKAIIAELEASASTPVQVTTQSTPGRVTASDSCPSDWHYFSGSCYFISDDTDDWSYSQSFCKQRGGHLAIIHTPEEQTFIWDLLPRGHWNAYWIGISDEKVEDDWYWVDGTKLVGGFWEDGEPNNHMNEDCGNMVKTEVLNRTATKSWYDAPCDMSRRWICEKETDVHSKSSSVQDVTNGSAEAHMLKTCANVTELTSELQALRKEKSELEKERSQLKAIIAELEASASTPVQVTTQSTPGRVTASDSCPSDWHYFSGSCYFISDDTDDWSYSQSFCKQRGGHLAIIHTPEEQTFIWDLLPRGHWNAYWIGISDEKVEDDWYWVDGTKLVGGFWEDGEPNNHMNEDCGNMVKTEVLNRTATKSWYDAPCDMSRRWICEKETDVHSKISSVQDVTNGSAEAHMLKTCANVTELTSELQALRKEKSELEKERSQLKAIIAELEASASTPVQVTTQSTPGRVTASDSCPSDWHYFSGSCYFISDDINSWSYSQSFCKQRGGHLAIIHTPEEQTFIWDLLPRGHWNAYWIGISDEKVEDDWYWVDGTKLVGGFWEDGEPNNHDDDEDCGNMVKTEVLSRIATKSWYDAPCYMSRRWICEKETDASS